VLSSRGYPRWHDGVAPGQSRDDDGSLLVGGALAHELARKYGTPLLILDHDVIDATIAAFARSATSFDVEVSYAAKAFITTEFARHLANRSIGLDVCSIGELVTAERADFPSAYTTLHGAGKSDDELLAASRGRVGSIVVDGCEELERLAELSSGECRADVLLRLNVGIAVRTHESVRTGGDDTKFGLHRRDEDAAIATLRANPHLRYAGLHAHLGSQVTSSASYIDCTSVLLDAALRFAAAGFVTKRIVIGGGFGVSTCRDDSQSLDIDTTIAAASAYTRNRANEYALQPPRLGIEPGRAVVALAGTTLYRVLAVKRQTLRTFVIVDGGIAENPRPALYGARHLVIRVEPAHGEEHEVTLCGRSCENDELGVARLPGTLRRGDLLAMCATGAYTYSMAGNYNRFPKPAVVAVSGGSDWLLARRESLDDLLRNDVDLRREPDEFPKLGATFQKARLDCS
jgi:diaminopimelate decarboxylase